MIAVIQGRSSSLLSSALSKNNHPERVDLQGATEKYEVDVGTKKKREVYLLFPCPPNKLKVYYSTRLENILWNI